MEKNEKVVVLYPFSKEVLSTYLYGKYDLYAPEYVLDKIDESSKKDIKIIESDSETDEIALTFTHTIHSSIAENDPENVALSYSNGVYFYIWSHVSPVIAFAAKNNCTLLTIPPSKSFKYHLMQTAEFPMGSLNLGYEIKSKLVCDFFASKKGVNCVILDRNKHRKDYLRYNFIRLLLIDSLLLYFLVRNKSISVKSPNSNKKGNLIIVRSPRHAELASNHKDDLHCSDTIYFPQLLANNAKEIKKQLLTSDLNIESPSKVTLIKLALKSFALNWKSKKQYEGVYVELKYRNNVCAFDISNYLVEILRLKPLTMYYLYLDKQLKNTTNNSIISFEMASRQAIIESTISRKYQLPYYAVQTAAMQYRKYYLFPAADEFYCDSLINVDKLKNNGFIANGIVKYSGILFKPSTKSSEYASTQKRIVYFSQPYNHATNILIVKTLLEQSSNNLVIVKLHPRDDPNSYKELYTFNNLTMSENNKCSVLIEHSDIVVSRTSSTLKEGILYKKPVIGCTFNDFDKKSNCDYLDILRKSQSCAFNSTDLVQLLSKNHESSVIAHYESLFGKTAINLVLSGDSHS